MTESEQQGHHGGVREPDSAENASAGAPPAKRPRRRWLRRVGVTIIVVLVLMTVVVGLAPTLASAPAVYNPILSMLNNKLQGKVQVDGLSLSWGGPTEIRGLRVTDAAQQQVLQVPRVSADAGVWRFVTATMNFGEIVVESPQILISQQRDGQVTLARALQLRPQSPSAPAGLAEPQPAGPPPELRGRLVVKDGTVKVVREGAGAYEVTSLDSQVELNTLNDVVAKLDLTLADGAQLTGDSRVHNLVSQGKLDLQQAKGTLRLKSDRSFQVEALAALAGQAQLKGGLNLDVDARVDAGKLEGHLALRVAGLQSAARAAADAKPINAELQGQVHWVGREVTGSLKLAGEAGQAQAELVYRQTDEPLNVSAAEILSAVLTGEALSLPDFSVNAQADVDLVSLGQAVPELLNVRAGTELTGGRLELTSFAIRGGEKPAAGTTLRLTGLTARRDDQPVRLEPISVSLDAGLETGQGLRVRQLQLTANFAQLNAAGLLRDLRSTFKANLGELHRELSPVFDLGALELAGELDGSLELERTSAEQVQIDLRATAAQLRYAAAGRAFELSRADLSHRGQFVFAQQELAKVLAQETKVNLDGQVVAAATGWYDLAQHGFRADLELARSDLAFLASRAQRLGLIERAPYSGGFRLQASVERPAGARPLTSRGEVLVEQLAVDGKPVADGDLRMKWDGAQLTADTHSLRLASAQLESTFAQLTAKDVQWMSGESLVVEGKLDGAADVARCLAAAAPVAGWEKAPDVAGRLVFQASGATAGGLLSVAGSGGIQQFVVGAGSAAIREEEVKFAYDVTLDQTRDTVSITECSLASRPLTAEVKGTIGQYTEKCVLDLTGRYSAAWDTITVLLHEFVPATADTVILAGTSTSEFKVAGPARQVDQHPSFGGVTTGAEIAWDSAELYGVKLGAAKLAPALEAGQLRLSRTAIPAAEGKVFLGCVLDFAPVDPTLQINGKLPLLQNVAVTKELSAQLLSRINPIFLHVASIEGRVNLSVQDVLAPFGPSLKERGAGQGQLDFARMKMQPGGLMAELLALGDMAKDAAYPVEIGVLEFVVRDGRIVYDNLTMSFAETFDLKFRGSVGFDNTLDLVVSVPVRVQLLERLGVKGPTQQYATALEGMRVDIPIVGTREQPKLDFAQVDVQSLLKDVLLQQPAKELEGLLKGLQGDKRQR